MNDFPERFGDYIGLKAQQTRIPITGTFELSPICNLDCKMCYVRKSKSAVDAQGGLLDIDFWYKCIEDAVSEGMLFCLLTGGEPFLFSNFRELCERLAKLPIYLSINTNATMLDETTIKWLKKIHVKQINISLYGASAETYQRLCGNGAVFDKVLHAMELLNQYQIKYEVHTTLTPANIGDYNEIIHICNTLQAHLKMAYYMYPPYRKGIEYIGKNEGRFSPNEAAEVALRYFRDALQTVEQYAEYIETTYMELKNPETIPFYGDGQMRCKGGQCVFFVDWKGNISACGLMESDTLNLNEVSFADGWKKAKKVHDTLTISEKCQYCNKQRICPTCAAAAYCETGSVSGTSEYCCAFSDRYEQLILEEYERLKNEGILSDL